MSYEASAFAAMGGYEDYAEFREALILLLQKPRLRERLGEIGQTFVQRNYRWKHIEMRYLELVQMYAHNVSMGGGTQG